ncbi:ATP-dependent helicase HrpB [Sphaerisporangium perillae]|uniref:ATP-dependent helicase HrpB n=1 Tax=Sphaerisporangium perillae TaxID=2935860 RepID=UPI00200C0169|nr:ATP-dependent helicase HrpB [Sphaerisporangium perillae]
MTVDESRAGDLPVRHALPELRAALEEAGGAVLTAPPGTGKTTLVPLALAGLDGGGPPRRVIVAEPRRIATRAAARRMAWLLRSEVGQEVGFTVRGEHRPGRRVQVMTTGVLLQRLQRDPELDGVDAVLVDECHERHLDADTALAFLLDVRATLRPDLRLLAASATADAAPWARLLGGAPVVHASGTAHEVEVVWAPPPRPVAPPHGMRVDPALLAHVAGVVHRALAERAGDVLCFLPGVGEIGRVAAALAGLAPRIDVLQVHGRAETLDAVLSPGPRRRVILATSVAESSLTVPGVRMVVDAGLAREPRTDQGRGLGSLTTVRVSKASAEQRAGRAGREAPGTVYRCWTEAEHARLPDHAQPEIALADLTAFALQAACWGTPDASALALLDPPPAASMAVAGRTLHALGALTDGRVTERGRSMAGIGVHPRLARALLDGPPEAAEVVALLSGELPRSAPDDLVAVWREARRGGSRDWRKETRRLTQAVRDAGRPARSAPDSGGPAPDSGGPARTPARSGSAAATPYGGGAGDDAVAGLVVALAYPERVARRRSGGYLMVSGTAATLPRDSRLASAEWLAIAVADRPAGSASARVRQAVVIDEDVAKEAAKPFHQVEEEIGWDGDVVARRVERLGAIELSSVPLPDADVGEAILAGLRAEGLSLLRWTPDAVALRERMAFCRRVLGDPWPDVSDAGLIEGAWNWLDLPKLRRRADLRRVDVASSLRRLLPWRLRLDEVAPERITVPSGSRVRVDYSGEQPVLAAKLQELFGWDAAPQVAGVPLVVHLLSPAGRPAAVTADLASFWREGYRAVRAELRGRYPKHPWPEDPLAAVPTRGTNRRGSG